MVTTNRIVHQSFVYLSTKNRIGFVFMYTEESVNRKLFGALFKCRYVQVKLVHITTCATARSSDILHIHRYICNNRQFWTKDCGLGCDFRLSSLPLINNDSTTVTVIYTKISSYSLIAMTGRPQRRRSFFVGNFRKKPAKIQSYVITPCAALVK